MPTKHKKEDKNSILILLSLIVLFIAIILLFRNIHNKKNINVPEQRQDIKNMFIQAQKYYNNGYFTDALLIYRKIIEIDPKNYGAHIGAGNSYIWLGLYNDAIKTFEKTFGMGYVDFRTYYGLGLTYYQMEEYNRSYIYLLQAYNLNPSNKNIVYYLLNTYNAIGLYDEAIKLTQNKLLSDSNNHFYYRKISLAYFLKNDLENAFENAQKAVEINSGYSLNHLTFGDIYLSMGNKEDALKELETALKLDGGSKVYEEISTVYFLLGKIENSKKSSILANTYPKNSFSLSILGLSLLRNKSYDKAVEEFNKAIHKKPDYYLPYKGLGMVYFKLGQKEKTIENFEKAIQLNSFDTESKKLLEEASKTKLEPQIKVIN